DWQAPPAGPKGERFPSTELEFTNRTTLEIRDGHGKALTVMTFAIPSGPTSCKNDLRRVDRRKNSRSIPTYRCSRTGTSSQGGTGLARYF
ncbi:hypothetical protein BGZ89_002061, partial [Linnemannia elongata]